MVPRLQYNFGFLVLLTAFWVPQTAAAAETADKFAHMGVSFALTTAGYGTLKLAFPETPRWKLTLVAAGAALAAGLTKELIDERKDPWDMVANAAGTTAAAGCILLFEF